MLILLLCKTKPTAAQVYTIWKWCENLKHGFHSGDYKKKSSFDERWGVKIYQNSVIVWLKMDMYFRFTCTCRLAYNCREHGSAESTQ